MSLHSPDVLTILSRFHAVVLHHKAGSGLRVRWSLEHNNWVRSADYGRYIDPWLAQPGEIHGIPDEPGDESLAAAIGLMKTVTNGRDGRFFCARCGRREARNHFIAPNVHGDPELYCLQVPSYEVVDSSGGNGQLKHWGSPFGCQSVKALIDSDINGPRAYIGPLAAYVFGRPLPADDVINRDWCSRCTGAAWNVDHNAAASGDDKAAWEAKEVQRHIRRLSWDLIEYYGDQ